MSRDLRADALAILGAGVAAVEPQRLVREFLAGRKAQVDGARTQVVAVGKAAEAMARGVVAELGAVEREGILVSPAGSQSGVDGFASFAGGHPIPNEAGVAGSLRILEAAAELGPDDLLLCLISGGGSALMTAPPRGLTLGDLRRTTDGLLRAGATIQELNAVRKHLDQLKGGRLARVAAPARVLSLILSDVVGDPLDVIASGPTAPDPTTFAEARAILERYALWGGLAAPVRQHLEAGLGGSVPDSPKPGDPCFERVENTIVGNNRLAMEAAAAAAAERDYRVEILGTELTGEARQLGGRLATRCRELRQGEPPEGLPTCLLGAGETTVTVTGPGRGGRNQEVALGAAAGVAGLDSVLIASLGTDGIDGPTDAAGALVTGDSLERARRRGLDPDDALAENDAYSFFQELDDLIITGPTGTNVMDLALVLVDRLT